MKTGHDDLFTRTSRDEPECN